jgi:hypothetical protein
MTLKSDRFWTNTVYVFFVSKPVLFSHSLGMHSSFNLLIQTALYAVC